MSFQFTIQISKKFIQNKTIMTEIVNRTTFIFEVRVFGDNF